MDDEERSLRQAIGLNVTAELARKRVRQGDAAKILGVGQASVSARLTGKVGFTATELARVARWLDVPVQRLFEPVPGSQRPNGADL